MAKSNLRIDILGTSVTISTDEKPEYLDMLLSKYRESVENVQRISGLKDPLKIAVLTGFLLCDDLYKAAATAPAAADTSVTAAEKTESGEFEQITLGMISRLQEILPGEDVAVTSLSGTGQSESPSSTEEPSQDHSENAPVAPPVAASVPVPVPKAPVAFYKLQNTVKNYEWGSPEWIPALMGQRNLSRVPWAELWMGVHPAGASRVSLPDGKVIPLPELIIGAADGSADGVADGMETAAAFRKLPFLFKLVAAAKPLSIQAHPNEEQALRGFQRENQQGIPLNAPNRNYRDPNAKPEILCALSPFAALCGFREAKEIRLLLGILADIAAASGEGTLKAALEALVAALEDNLYGGGEAFLTALLDIDRETCTALGELIKSKRPLLEQDSPEYRDEWTLCLYLSTLYPGDSGIIAPLYLNIIELAPGQAMYLPAGTLHSYIHGLAIELMADSDNVLRGGLTSKHVDRKELLKILNFSAYKPEILDIPNPAPQHYTYPAEAGECSLSVMSSSGAEVPYREKGPSIVIITKGSAVVSAEAFDEESGTEMTLNTGESVFIPAGEKQNLMFSGAFTAYVAAAIL